MIKKYIQIIDGARRISTIKHLPDFAGIYFVYVGWYNEEESTIYPRKLVYIGESENIHKRINDGHERQPDWENELQQDEIICFSYTEVEDEDIKRGDNRLRVEAAYIVEHEPVVNVKHKESFNYNETRIVSSPRWDSIGKSYITQDFTVSEFSNY